MEVVRAQILNSGHVASMLVSDGYNPGFCTNPVLLFPSPYHPSYSPAGGVLSPMSGLSTVDQLGSSQQQPDLPISENTAASLRAVALKTLKAKRRKGPDGLDLPTSLPPRPTVNTPSIQLDYGSEDQPGTSAAAPTAGSPPVPVASVKSSTPPAPGPMDVDEDQTREEGEISDSESMPPPKSPQVSRQNTRHSGHPAPARTTSKDKQMPPPIKPLSVLPNVTVKLEPSPLQLPDPPPSASQSSSRYPPAIDYEMYAIDEEHARPGLTSQCLHLLIWLS